MALDCSQAALAKALLLLKCNSFAHMCPNKLSQIGNAPSFWKITSTPGRCIRFLNHVAVASLQVVNERPQVQLPMVKSKTSVQSSSRSTATPVTPPVDQKAFADAALRMIAEDMLPLR